MAALPRGTYGHADKDSDTGAQRASLISPWLKECEVSEVLIPDCARTLVQLHLVQLDQTKDLINRDRICIRHLQGEGCAVKGYSSIIDKNDLHHGAQVSVYLRLCRPRRPARRRGAACV